MQSVTSQELIQSPTPGPSQFALRYEYSQQEIDALRRLVAAQAAIAGEKSWDAAMDMRWALIDFYRERLTRYFPAQADLVRWVFDLETIDQGEIAALTEPLPEPA
ncbi:MAG TPA: hypothetical protein PKD75_11350 [Tepidiformaceae bacterium]|nr:hypothetical protein [Tepidiformaceae bacterium]